MVVGGHALKKPFLLKHVCGTWKLQPTLLHKKKLGRRYGSSMSVALALCVLELQWWPSRYSPGQWLSGNDGQCDSSFQESPKRISQMALEWPVWRARRESVRSLIGRQTGRGATNRYQSWQTSSFFFIYLTEDKDLKTCLLLPPVAPPLHPMLPYLPPLPYPHWWTSKTRSRLDQDMFTSDLWSCQPPCLCPDWPTLNWGRKTPHRPLKPAFRRGGASAFPAHLCLVSLCICCVCVFPNKCCSLPADSLCCVWDFLCCYTGDSPCLLISQLAEKTHSAKVPDGNTRTTHRAEINTPCPQEVSAFPKCSFSDPSYYTHALVSEYLTLLSI